MAQRNIKIHARAVDSYRRKVAWYYLNCGLSFVSSFDADLERTYGILASMPSIGKVVKQTSTRTYAEFVSHPLVIIQYWYNADELHIMNLVFTSHKL